MHKGQIDTAAIPTYTDPPVYKISKGTHSRRAFVSLIYADTTLKEVKFDHPCNFHRSTFARKREDGKRTPIETQCGNDLGGGERFDVRSVRAIVSATQFSARVAAVTHTPSKIFSGGKSRASARTSVAVPPTRRVDCCSCPTPDSTRPFAAMCARIPRRLRCSGRTREGLAP